MCGSGMPNSGCWCSIAELTPRAASPVPGMGCGAEANQPQPAPSALQVVLHPQWGSAVYPASLFAKAPLEAVRQAIRDTEAELRAQGLEGL